MLAIHELEGRVITANMEKVRLGDEREKLMAQFNTLREKFTDLAETKAQLQQQLIMSEEDRLKIAETLIDLKMEKAQGSGTCRCTRQQHVSPISPYDEH